MPTIEVLPQTNPSHVAPGWAYVPESAAPDPSKLLQTTGGRRTAAKTAIDALTGAHTKTQASKIRIRLDELSRDNPGRAEVEIPGALTKEINEGRWKVVKGTGKGASSIPAGAGAGKQSGNVKKILISSKTWAHHAADEEVRLQNAAESHRGRRDVVMVDSPTEPVSQPSEYGHLLDVKMAAPPSQQTIDALLKAPSLSYGASVAGPPASLALTRKFCAMCGYYGKIKCVVCGTHVCGLRCKVTHDATEHPHR